MGLPSLHHHAAPVLGDLKALKSETHDTSAQQSVDGMCAAVALVTRGAAAQGFARSHRIERGGHLDGERAVAMAHEAAASRWMYWSALSTISNGSSSIDLMSKCWKNRSSSSPASLIFPLTSPICLSVAR